MADAVADWARRTQRNGRPVIEDSHALARLTTVYAHANISEGLSAKVLGKQLAGEPDMAFGPTAKLFSTQAFIGDSADLLDLAAPESLLRNDAALASVERGYRHATATSIYGGSSEIMRSMVAERRLGMPRSRT
jgi:alkylation response protein AidB-like acyl-CoA dehydrogenase